MRFVLVHGGFHDDGSMTFATVEGATELFYDDCDAETAQWAFDHLCAERGGETSTTPVSVPRYREADLPRSYIPALAIRRSRRGCRA